MVGGKDPATAAGTRHGVVVDVHGPEGEAGTHLVAVGKGAPEIEDVLEEGRVPREGLSGSSSLDFPFPDA